MERKPDSAQIYGVSGAAGCPPPPPNKEPPIKTHLDSNFMSNLLLEPPDFSLGWTQWIKSHLSLSMLTSFFINRGGRFSSPKRSMACRLVHCTRRKTRLIRP